MKVQKIKLAEHKYIWLVIDDNHLPIEPISSYLSYLYNVENSPSTLRSYANHLKLFWDYITQASIDWQNIKISALGEFVHWLRSNDVKVIHINAEKTSCRTERTVNTILSAISSFYRYHNQLGNTNITIVEPCHMPANRYKSLLYHVNASKPVYKRIIKLKSPKNLINTLSQEQISLLLESCNNIRDQFLVALLYETGMRIGQALGLRHIDIKSWDNEIQLIYRLDNVNQIRGKSKNANVICVSTELMKLYAKYLEIDEDIILDSEYVFVNYSTGKPLTYGAVNSLFKRLSKRTNIYVRPHMLRHTHTTDLINNNWEPALIQKRLGHSSVQTTIDTYTHINHKELKEQFKIYQNNRSKISYDRN